VAFHRLTVPGYAGGLRVGDDYVNNAVAGTPAPADNALGAGVYAGSYFFALGEVVTGAGINRGLKALAQNCDFLDDEIVQMALDYAAADAALSASLATEAAFRTRERTSPLVVNADATLTAAQQLVYMDVAGGGLLTLPDPATCARRHFHIYLSTTATKISRLMPNAAELINGAAGGYPLHLPGAHYMVFSPDGVDWIASVMPAIPDSDTLRVFRSVPTGNQAAATVCEVYGSGFKRIFEVRQNGFEIGTVGGSWILRDDGRISVTVGGGGGNIELHELVVRDTEDPDYDGVTERASSPVSTGITGI
jgi:hypothetical protein